jgi:two-component system, OmpR family, sensor histidine kinase ArlS
MGIKLRITLLFTLLAMVILLLVCGSVYYFSYRGRLTDIQTRLIGNAITTGRLLSESSIFDENLLQKIDSASSPSMPNKVIEMYDSLGNRSYWYSDTPSDSIAVPKELLRKAWERQVVYFRVGPRDGIALFYRCAGHGQVIVSVTYDKDGLEKLAELRQVLFFAFIGGLSISIIGGYLFSLQLLRPLRKIADEVNDISAGNLTRRIESSAHKDRDEWHYLSHTLNQLLNRLQESFETQGLFISNASHELSTPLTVMSSQLEISLQRKRNEEEYRQVISSVYKDVQQLSRLTQTLLEYARASGTAGGLKIDLVRIDEVLLSLPGEMSKVDPAYTVTLDFDQLPEQADALLVYGNEDLLFMAIKNVVINACKYAADHHALVSLKISSTRITITVSDKGKGMSQRDVEKIFQPFFRAADTHATPGFGLGLSLTSRILKLHKGTILAESVLGKGTTFTIELPAPGH